MLSPHITLHLPCTCGTDLNASVAPGRTATIVCPKCHATHNQFAMVVLVPSVKGAPISTEGMRDILLRIRGSIDAQLKESYA